MDLCAQRTMDKLGRGLVATVTQSGSGNFVSWRVLGEEYYDVAYNLYANGELVAKGLSASNYVHTGGTAETRYTVAPVVKGKEGEQCDPVKRFKEFSFYSLTGQNTGFLRVPGAEMKGRNGEDLTENYMFNDAVLADVDGDGMPSVFIRVRPEWRTWPTLRLTTASRCTTSRENGCGTSTSARTCSRDPMNSSMP